MPRTPEDARIQELLQRSVKDQEIRERAQAAAREIIDRQVGRLSEVDLRGVFQHLNTCQGRSGAVVYTRFALSLSGHNANTLVKALDRLNPAVERLWKADGDGAVAQALEQFFEAEITNAGTGFPTAILFLKDPERYAVWFAFLDRVVRRLMGAASPGPRTAAAYLEYCDLVRRMRARYGIPASLHDLALSELGAAFESEDADREQDELPDDASGDALAPSLARAVLTRDLATDLDVVADDLGLSRETVKRIAKAALGHGQIVLTGPPGTGKTELAIQLAQALAGDRSRVEKVQFHPSYGYEEFIEGLRPEVENGHLTYRVVPGIFRQLCDRARAASERAHVLLVDEINRGNLPRIFGELLMLLERRGETVTLPSSKERFSIPKNVLLIGTMNSADRSIALFDLALRRRFRFFELGPDEGVLRTWLERKGLPIEVVTIFQNLNRRLEDAGVERDRLVGHSYFMQDALDEEALEEIWETSILPLVRELFSGDPAKAADFTLEKVRARARA